MYAVLRVNSFDQERLARSEEQMQEINRIHAAQPGFLGTAEVDLEDGRRFVSLQGRRTHADHGRSRVRM